MWKVFQYQSDDCANENYVVDQACSAQKKQTDNKQVD